MFSRQVFQMELLLGRVTSSNKTEGFALHSKILENIKQLNKICLIRGRHIIVVKLIFFIHVFCYTILKTEKAAREISIKCFIYESLIKINK